MDADKVFFSLPLSKWVRFPPFQPTINKTELMDTRTTIQKTSDTILEEKREVVIGGRVFKVAPPTCATLIAISRLVPQVPYVEVMGDRINETLACAKDSHPLFLQVATMILGVKKRSERRRFSFKKEKDEVVELAQWLIDNASPREINEARKVLLSMMQVEDFFDFTAFLQEISLIQKTREAVITTQSGQS